VSAAPGTVPAARQLATAGPAVRPAQAITAGQRTGAAPALLPSARSSRQLPCRDDPEMFFAESPEDVEYAKALCGDCPVRMSCLAGAMERREPWGVWGGELFLRGEVVPRKRPRGRPRKTEVAA
jgi:WhiB family redox-sensing transcriptional regulator